MSQNLSDPNSANSGASPGGLLHRVSKIPTPLIFLFSVGIALTLLWREGSLADAGKAMKRADPVIIVAGLLLYLAGLALLCVRWDQLVKMIKGRSNLPRASEAFLTSVVINYAAPIGLAVPSRAALTKRALGLDAAETGAVALWEVAVDVLVLAILSGLWLLLGGWNADLLPDTSGTQRLVAAVFVIVGMLAVAVIAATVARRKPALWTRITGLARSIGAYPAKRPGDALLTVAITVLYWLVQAAVMWLLLRALEIDSSFTLVLGLVSLPILIGMLSPVPGGAGIREALMLGVARVHSVDSASVLLAALTYRIALFASIPVLYAAVRFWISRSPAPVLTTLEQVDANT